jgi:aryl-alcohol dehydrogenase-like predicted oxidoreductase
MDHATLGALGPVSRLTLGGGGLGQLWGETSRAEAVATVHAAVEAGIDLLDLAPLYGRGEAERVVGEAFGGKLPAGVRVTTKCQLGDPEDESVEGRIRRHLARSLEALRLERVDVLLLHSNLISDGFRFPREADAAVQRHFATPWSRYVEEVIPTFEALVAEGRIGAWGITGIGLPERIDAALATEPRPAVVQCIANCLDSAGDIRRFDEAERPRERIAAAVEHDVGVMGIRAVQAGALTDAFDRPIEDDSRDMADYRRAAPFRALAAELGTTPAALAHRYALAIPGVDTVVLGVKNRQELAECVAAEAAGPLPAEVVARVDRAVGGRC